MFHLKRVYGLDVLRSIAILAVVFGHGATFLQNTPLKGFPYIFPFDGVDLFFVLSGYLIGTILLKEINKKTFGVKSLIEFWKRRWFRTLPNYYLFLLINFIVVSSGFIYTNISPDQINWRFLFFMQNLGHGFYGFFWESWSLAVEEWFYLLTPILLIVLLRIIKPKQAFIITALAMLLLPVLYRLKLYNPGVSDFIYDIAFRKNILSRLDSIAFGLIAAWLLFYYKDHWLRFKWPSIIAGALLFVGLIFYYQPFQSWYKQILFYSLLPLSITLMFPAFSEWRKKGVGVFVFISKISYSLYLVHFLVLEIIQDHFNISGLNYLLYWAGAIIISSLVYKYYELPMMNLRDKKAKHDKETPVGQLANN